MISEHDVEHIAQLADIGMRKEELAEFTVRFNTILDYFDILDQVEGEEVEVAGESNVFRDDVVCPSLPQEKVLSNTREGEEGFFRAPRVM